MRFLELYLKAYGPFTERRIELPREGHGLHVIFGRNEAGKSSALRAIRHLLYGIPAQTTDDFLHDYRSMRIGGRLGRSDGSQLALLRKKGSKQTLRTWDDAGPLDDGALAPFLRGVPEELFRSFFGIDHATLVEGGESLLADEGDVGRSLFAAGLGSGSLRDVISGLEQEGKALFAARGTKPRINAALARLQQLRTQIKTDSLKPREWQALERSRADAEAELGEVESELGALRSERSRLGRLGAAQPLLARRRLALEALEALGAVTQLGDGFAQRLGDAREMRRSASKELRRAQDEVRQLDEKLEGLQLDPAILQHGELIDGFRDRLGRYGSARDDLPKREGEREHLAKELAGALSALGAPVEVEQLDLLRSPLQRSGLIQELADAHARLQTRLDGATRTLRLGSQRQERLRAQLGALPTAQDTAGLERALATARSLGDVDDRVRVLASRCEAARRSCESQLAALGLWKGNLEELARAAVPAMETIERYQGDFDAMGRERSKLEERLQQARDEIRDVDARLEALRRGGAVPSDADLSSERERRDAAWQLIRRRWIEGESLEGEIHEFAGPEHLPDLYERRVSAADEIADRLRADAERVASHTELIGLRTRAEQALEENTQAGSRLAEGEHALALEWRDIWRSLQIEPNPPREMLAWWRRQQKLVAAAGDGRMQADELRTLEKSRSACREGLLAALESLGESAEAPGEELSGLLFHAGELLESIEAVEQQRADLVSAIDEGERSLDEARDDEREAREGLSRWREEWRAAIAGLGLSDDARPSEARDRLQAIGALFQTQSKLADLDRRIAAMRGDQEKLERDLHEFVGAQALELAGQPVEQTVRRLASMFAEADAQETRRKDLLEDLERESEKARNAERELAEAERELVHLREEASCADDPGLDEALRRDREWRKARERVDDIEQQLVEIGGGTAVEQLESEAREVDRDSLPGRLEALRQQIDELEERRGKAMDRRAEARAELARMDGSARVADAAEDAEEVLANLRRDVERYVELRLARAILAREIEHYRGEHQTPLVLRARELFRDLTLGAYRGLHTDDEEDGPQLMAVRADDGRNVGVEGMSSGTRDQLFLALRLATLEEYLERSEPMPFIVDDILVNFDDERARATLDVLVGLGERTQVLLFTHHGRIREHAEELDERASVLALEQG